VEQADLSFLADGNRLKFLDACKFALVRALIVEARTVNDFDGAIDPGNAASQTSP